MKNRLIISNTFYQLIFAIQMKNTVFKNDRVVMLLSDHSLNAFKIYEKLVECNVFDESYYIETKKIENDSSRLEKWKDCLYVSFDRQNRYSEMLSEISNKQFDEILCFNYLNFEIDGIYATLSKFNCELKVSLYEEGILSYNQTTAKSGNRRKVAKQIRKILKKPCFKESIDDIYCFYPQLYKGHAKAIEVPRIRRDSTVSTVIKKIFNPKTEGYTQKYIFFTSVYDFEGGGPIGEFELVSQIAEIVGKSNLLIKMHPRDDRDIYIKNGFSVDINSSIPWEAVQLSGKFEDKVFMTVNSGSVLAGSLMSDRPVETYYMYKLCNVEHNEACKITVREIKRLLEDDSMKETIKNVHIAERIEDIL